MILKDMKKGRRKAYYAVILLIIFLLICGFFIIKNKKISGKAVLEISEATGEKNYEDWTMAFHDLNHTGTTSEIINLPLILKWKYQYSYPGIEERFYTERNKHFGYLLTYEDKIYSVWGDQRGRIFDTDSGTNFMRFTAHPADAPFSESYPAMDNESIAVHFVDYNAVYDIDNLEITDYVHRWGAGNGGTALFNNIAYFNSPAKDAFTSNNVRYAYGGMHLNALETKKENLLWKHSLFDVSKFTATEYITPTIANNIFYSIIDRNPSSISSYDADTGDIIWSKSLGSQSCNFDTSIAYENDMLYVGAKGTGCKKLYALNATTGDIIWAYNVNAEIYAPIVSNKIIYFASKDNYFYAINSTSRALKWRFLSKFDTDRYSYTDIQKNHRIPAISGDLIFFGSDSPENRLYALNISTGREVWRYQFSYPIGSPIVSKGMLLVSDERYTLYSFIEPSKDKIIRKIKKPLISQPAIVEKTGSFISEYESSPSDYDFNAKLILRYGKEFLINLENFRYDNSKGRWILNFSIPLNVPEELYDLNITSNLGSDVSYNSVKIISNFKTSFKFIHAVNPLIRKFNPGINSENDEAALALRKVIEEWNLLNPEFVLISGGLTENGQDWQYRDLIEILRKSEVPIYLVPGDSDALGLPSSSSHINYERFLGERYYSFNYGNSHFLGIDTTENGISSSQLTFINQDLQLNQNKQSRIIFYYKDALSQIENIANNGRVNLSLFSYTRWPYNSGPYRTYYTSPSGNISFSGYFRIVNINETNIDALGTNYYSLSTAGSGAQSNEIANTHISSKKCVLDKKFNSTSDACFNSIKTYRTGYKSYVNITNILPWNPEYKMSNSLIKLIVPSDGKPYNSYGGEIIQIIDVQNDNSVYYINFSIPEFLYNGNPVLLNIGLESQNIPIVSPDHYKILAPESAQINEPFNIIITAEDEENNPVFVSRNLKIKAVINNTLSSEAHGNLALNSKHMLGSSATVEESFSKIMPIQIYVEDENGKNGKSDGIDISRLCTPGNIQQCGFNIGECRYGIKTCNEAGSYGNCIGGIEPSNEICDNKDNDCDGLIDRLTRPCSNICFSGIESCNSGAWDTCSALPAPDNYNQECSAGIGACQLFGTIDCFGTCNAIPRTPSFEICDEIDNDCDGLIDEGCECINGETQACGIDTGECVSGIMLCNLGHWSDCNGNIEPSNEICDNKDNDCDGLIDEEDICSCTNKQSFVCSQHEICTGVAVLASDTNRCCNQLCINPIWNNCNQCGSGTFNLGCDLEECGNVREECFWQRAGQSYLDGNCLNCLGISCSSYSSQEECEQDMCELGICEFYDSACRIQDSDRDGLDDSIDKCPLKNGINLINGCPPPVNYNKFQNSLSTNFLELTHYDNISLYLGIENKGIINFTENVTIGGLDFDKNVKIERTYIEINTTGAPELNVSAEITLINISDREWRNLKVLEDGKLCEECSILSYVDGILKFNVSHFSRYSIGIESKTLTGKAIYEVIGCGDNVCDSAAGESCSSCPEDCGNCPQPPSGGNSGGGGGGGSSNVKNSEAKKNDSITKSFLQQEQDNKNLSNLIDEIPEIEKNTADKHDYLLILYLIIIGLLIILIIIKFLKQAKNK
jgi:outer membrane protein assembly factor BamB